MSVERLTRNFGGVYYQMRAYEVILSGMMCCFAKGDPACSICPYKSDEEFCKRKLFGDILEYMTEQDKRILALCSKLKKSYKTERS